MNIEFNNVGIFVVKIKIYSIRLTELYVYDKNNNAVYHKSSDGFQWEKEYDSSDNMLHYKNNCGKQLYCDYDTHGNMVHVNNSDGFESWTEYDKDDNEIHYKDSTNGFEEWYNSNGSGITKEEYDVIHE